MKTFIEPNQSFILLVRPRNTDILITKVYERYSGLCDFINNNHFTKFEYKVLYENLEEVNDYMYSLIPNI